MQINQISFTSAIKVNSSTNYPEASRVDTYTKEVFNTLYGKYYDLPYLEPTYSEQQSKTIGDFLKEKIGDFSPQSGMFLRKIDGDVFLFTGEEAQYVKNADRKLEKKLNNLKRECDEFERTSTLSPAKASKRAKRKYDIKSEEFHKQKDAKLLQVVEPREITLKMDESGKINEIQYTVEGKEPEILTRRDIY